MEPARRIARIVGPVLLAVAPTEALNRQEFVGNSAPGVFTIGVAVLSAGVAILQAHRRWEPDWTALVTLLGWAFVVGGLYRMAFPTGPQTVDSAAAYGVTAALFAIGVVLTWQGYRRRG